MKQCLLLEKNSLFREGLAVLLEWSAELEALQATSVEEAHQVLGGPRNKIELAIVNVDSLNGNLIGLIEELRRANPDVPVLALTGGQSLEVGARALQAGANDVFCLRAPVEELMDLVVRLVRGQSPNYARRQDKEFVAKYRVRNFVDVHD
jgi:DNA-binding NarL/FixJ family response regulator